MNIRKNKIKKIISVVGWFIKSIIVLAIIIGIYFGINELYLQNDGYITIWGAADVLYFYGTLLGASATILALVITIYFTNKNNKEEREYQVFRLVAEYKNERLKEKFETRTFELNEIKDTILLKDLEPNSFIDIFFTTPSLNKFISNLGKVTSKVINEISDKENDLEDENFWALNKETIVKIETILTEFAFEMQNIDNKIEELEEKKEEFEEIIPVIKNKQKLDKMKTSVASKLQIQANIQKLNLDIKLLENKKDLEGIRIQELEENEEIYNEKLIEKKEIVKNVFDLLKDKRDEYQDEYIQGFNIYTEYRNHRLLKNIESNSKYSK